MPRAIWSGAISLGLLNVPVRMYSAIAEQDLHFHYLHRKDASRIGYEKVCRKEGKPVPDAEIVKAYALLGVIEARRKGKAIDVESEVEPAETPDLLEALKASLEERRGRAASHRRLRSRASSASKAPRARRTVARG